MCPGRKVVGDFGMGQEWLPVEARQDRIVCNIGDQLMRVSDHSHTSPRCCGLIGQWSDDRLKSTYHRVIHRGSKFRVSIPFFFEPPRDMTITPIKSMVPEGEEGLVKPFTYFDHLKVSSQPGYLADFSVDDLPALCSDGPGATGRAQCQ